MLLYEFRYVVSVGMGFIPSKMVSAFWRRDESEIQVSDEFSGKSGSEVIEEINRKREIDLD